MGNQQSTFNCSDILDDKNKIMENSNEPTMDYKVTIFLKADEKLPDAFPLAIQLHAKNGFSNFQLWPEFLKDKSAGK